MNQIFLVFNNILLVLAEREGRPIAASLVIHDDDTLYGRYGRTRTRTLPSTN